MRPTPWEYRLILADSLVESGLNALGHDPKASIRTGDTTAYANVIVVSG